MTIDHVNHLLNQSGLPNLKEVVGKKFVFLFQDNPSDDGLKNYGIGGTILGVEWYRDEDVDFLFLYVSLGNLITHISYGGEWNAHFSFDGSDKKGVLELLE
jgi:hypothetical protein